MKELCSVVLRERLRNSRNSLQRCVAGEVEKFCNVRCVAMQRCVAGAVEERATLC